MAGTPRDIATLESWFETGDKPTQQQFYDLFASFVHYLKVKQETGSSVVDIMSQKATTDAISAAVNTLKGGVGSEADTLKKLHDLIVSVGELVGQHDASTGALPSTGSGASGAIDKGDYWIVSVGGTIPLLGDLDPGDVIFASVDGANEAADFFYLPFSSSIPDATASVKGILKLFNTFQPTSARTDGAVDEATLLAAMSANKVLHNKTSHGLSVGQCLKINSGTGAVEAFTYSSSTFEHIHLLGIVSDVIDANNFLYVRPGGIIDTLSGLTPGALYYINHVDASLTTDTAVALSVPRYEALIAITATTGLVLRNETRGKTPVLSFSSNFSITNAHAGAIVKVHTSGSNIEITLSATIPGLFVRLFVNGDKAVTFTGATGTLYGSTVGSLIPPGSWVFLVCKNFSSGSFEWDIIVQLPAYTQNSFGNNIRFDCQRKYGTTISPITGNLTLDSEGLLSGTVVLIIHNDSVEPSYPSEFKKASSSGNYVAGVNNYIYAHAVDASTIIYTITQIP